MTTSNVEVRKPEEMGEYTTTIIDTARILPELLAIAAVASKLKVFRVFVSRTDVIPFSLKTLNTAQKPYEHSAKTIYVAIFESFQVFKDVVV